MGEAMNAVAPREFTGIRNIDDALRVASAGGCADLIVLTLDSDMNGLELLEALRAGEYWRNIPVAIGPDMKKLTCCRRPE
jgi:CheY-like chemotaxis protein